MKFHLRPESRLLIFFLATIVVLLLAFAAFSRRASAPTNVSSENAAVQEPWQRGTLSTFTEVKTPTFVRSIPSNNALLAVAPNTITVEFSEAIGPASTMSVLDDDNRPVHLGAPTFNGDRTTMTALVRSGVTGPIVVTYYACLVDGSCSAGKFGFSIEIRSP